MSYPMVVTVAHHPMDEAGGLIRDRLIAALDRVGMERSGVHTRVPVRIRSEAFHPNGRLRPLRAEGTALDVLVFVRSSYMAEDSTPWETLLEGWVVDDANHLTVTLDVEPNTPRFAALSSVQRAEWLGWDGLDDDARARRIVISLINQARRKLSGLGIGGEREPIFVSHAKRDGRKAAERVVRHVADPDSGLQLATFYDVKALDVGADWERQLEHGATTGSLLALLSDAYDGRPWCNAELLWAKRNRRPILVVDIGRQKTGRTFPYGGNAPHIANLLADTAGIERVLLELLSEGLRCDLFEIAVRARGGDVIALPRPPELTDLAWIAKDTSSRPIVYPDPPLPDVELTLLRAAAGGREILSWGEME